MAPLRLRHQHSVGHHAKSGTVAHTRSRVPRHLPPRQPRKLRPARATPPDSEGPASEGPATSTPSGKAAKQQQQQQQQQAEPEVGAGLKAVWYGAEQFGKLLRLTRPQQQQAAKQASRPAARLTRDEMLAAIRADYDNQYFVRGVGDMAAYAPDCVFADPFVSFAGTERFKQNVSNLGGLMSDIRIDVYDWVEGPSSLETRWRFSALLDLPWRPRLAAAGGTTHVFDVEQGLVVRHEERWDVEPAKVVAQLLLPAAKVPSNPWETFLLSASASDVPGMWFVLSPSVLKLSAAVVAGSLLWGLVAGGEGPLPGPAMAALELLCCGCVVTEVVKFAQGMQGGETGTGGRF